MARTDRAAPAALFALSRQDHERAGILRLCSGQGRAVRHRPPCAKVRAEEWRASGRHRVAGVVPSSASGVSEVPRSLVFCAISNTWRPFEDLPESSGVSGVPVLQGAPRLRSREATSGRRP